MTATANPTNASLTSLFVGNLDPRVYRELLTEIFSLAGHVTQCHVVYDKTTGLSSGFGFVHYEDHATAEAAMDKFRGRSIYGKLLTIDWARASNRENGGAKSDDAVGQYCLFVGNLSPDVTDEQLVTAFSEFGSCTSAKCAKDPVTYKTQGFAFVSFRDRVDAVTAMEAMNGQLLNNRPLRVDWAKGKTGGGKMDETQSTDPKKDTHLSFEAILAQTSVNNITAYVSGLPVMTSEDKIREKFAAYGPIREIRIPDSAKSSSSDTMYAFVRYVDHASAAKAIFDCQAGAQVDGNNVNVHWGREVVRRGPSSVPHPPVHMHAHAHAHAHVPYYHPGYQQPPQQYPYQYAHPGQQPPQVHSQRPMYSSQPYARAAPPGPMHQPNASSQHRYRPY